MPDPENVTGRLAGVNVSRETQERLEIHLALLRKWNPKINLVSKSTLEDGWHRHIIDSVQVFKAAPPMVGTWVDFGTGGGFPGLVCAILAAELSPTTEFVLVESDHRKCAFLRTLLAEVGLSTRIESRRIEDLAPQNAGMITARAVASLDRLFELSKPHLSQGGFCIFPKGARHNLEIQAASERWRFKLQRKPSITDPKGAILVFGDIARV